LICYCFVVSKADLPRTIAAEVPRLLRKERTRRGLSIYRLSKMSGVSQQMINYVERGLRNPTLDTILRMAMAIDVDLSELLKRASTAKNRKISST
jgi:transcriptional regulator with XRE-family HTH domain